MNPIKPVTHIVDAVIRPIKALFVVGICFAINIMTAPDYLWVKWVALGMGISVLVAWGRALKTLLTAGALAGLGYVLYRWFQKRGTNQSAPT